MNGRSSGKLYYSISEVSELTQLEATVLRFWEREFGQLRPKKNRAGNRMYREKDIQLIHEIKQLTRDEGYTLDGAKKRIQEAGKAKAKAKAKASVVEKAPAPDLASLPPDLLDYLRKELTDIKDMLE
jgi:DNA-binding transcriptional MerR regulator